jgi:hypothetical protein
VPRTRELVWRRVLAVGLAVVDAWVLLERALGFAATRLNVGKANLGAWSTVRPCCLAAPNAPASGITVYAQTIQASVETARSRPMRPLRMRWNIKRRRSCNRGLHDAGGRAALPPKAHWASLT